LQNKGDVLQEISCQKCNLQQAGFACGAYPPFPGGSAPGGSDTPLRWAFILAQVGRRAHAMLLAHMQRFMYSAMGALRWKRDVTEYADILRNSHSPTTNAQVCQSCWALVLSTLLLCTAFVLLCCS